MKSCPYCLSERRSERIEAREMSQATRDRFTYVLCADCGSVHIDEIPADIARYYNGYYSLATGPARRSLAAKAKRTAAIFLQPLIGPAALTAIRPWLRHPPPWIWPVLSPNLQSFLYARPRRDARILDVGCGNGAFIANLRKLGFARAEGVDPFVEAESLGAAAAYVRQADIGRIDGSYDIILFNHSLEHLPAPTDALRKSLELLAPGGTVIVQIPNVESPEFQQYRQHWWGLHAPRHFSLPTRAGMERAVRAAGLVVSDRIFTSRFDNYLYSREHSLDIADHDPQSWLTRGPSCIWTDAEIEEATRKAVVHNAAGTGDWVCYYLRRGS